MVIKNKKSILIQRLFIWTIYLYSGFILYFEKGYLYSFFVSFSRVVYPISIFWLQIRLKKKTKFLPIDPSMTTSQLWFSILPVFASILAVVLTILNSLFFILKK